MTMNKMHMTSYADLLKLPSDSGDAILEIPLSEIHAYEKGNCFHVVDDDEEMLDTLDSIENNGVIQPAIVRRREDGSYELISGHRRKRACELLGMKTMPVICRDYDDRTAESVMNDTNLHRSLRTSEIASICKSKMDEMSHKGKVTADGRSASKVGRRTGKSARSVYRYARLVNLIPDLLKAVDEKKLSVTVAEQISYVSEEVQKWLRDLILHYNVKVTLEQANKIRALDEDWNITREKLEAILFASPKQEKDKRRITFEKELLSYFPKGYSEDDIRIVVMSLVRNWKNSLDEGK